MTGRSETRASLLSAAGRVAAQRGLRDASIDEIARAAGFTKGAFYANFESKEELFLAMLDERFERRAAEMHAVTTTGDDPEEQARRGGDQFQAYVAGDPEWERLFFEFAALAARDASFREELVARYRGLREHMAADYERRAASLDFELPFPAKHLALMTFAMGNGVALEQVLEPDAVPDGFFGQMLAIWVAGLRAIAEAPDAGDHLPDEGFSRDALLAWLGAD